MKHAKTIAVTVILLALFVTVPSRAYAQFGDLGDKLKKKAEEKITEKKPAEQPAQQESTTVAPKTATPAAGEGAAAKDSFALYTKFDFVPGEKVLFYDDLAREETGEFPSRWNLKEGVFEIAKVGGDPWIMASTRGTITPKLDTPLPDKYTVEFEYLNRTRDYGGAHWIEFDWFDGEGNVAAKLVLENNALAEFYTSDAQGNLSRTSEIKLPETFASGIHHIRIMVAKTSTKCYVDEQRVVNVPRSQGLVPTTFGITFYGGDEDFEKEKMFVRNFRYAQGGKTLKEQLDESGKIITHGIYFDSGSDRIKGESNKTLAEIGQLLTENPSLKLSIEGHTDSDGADDYNMSLSQRRAEAVRSYLTATYKIDAARLTAKGWGKSKPIDTNNTPEGKANNRRVELVKMP